jgi:DNA (cytosine-5)-methyltransferase 1
MLNGLDLFSGIGGLTLALSPWVRPIAYCERDRYAVAVLLSRMQEGRIHSAPIWDEILTLKASMLPTIDIIYGGFPCQDLSSSGTRKGLAGERSGLFFEILRLADEIKPSFIFLENVCRVRKELHIIGRELADLGYDSRWCSLSAYDVGASHQRERWFLLAHAKSIGDLRALRNISLEDAEKKGSEISREKKAREPLHADRWKSEPDLARVADGIPHRMDRVRGIGNAVVPLQAREAFKRLCGII